MGGGKVTAFINTSFLGIQKRHYCFEILRQVFGIPQIFFNPGISLTMLSGNLDVEFPTYLDNTKLEKRRKTNFVYRILYSLLFLLFSLLHKYYMFCIQFFLSYGLDQIMRIYLYFISLQHNRNSIGKVRLTRNTIVGTIK